MFFTFNITASFDFGMPTIGGGSSDEKKVL